MPEVKLVLATNAAEAYSHTRKRVENQFETKAAMQRQNPQQRPVAAFAAFDFDFTYHTLTHVAICFRCICSLIRYTFRHLHKVDDIAV
jgi:hypothetical protein